MKNHILFLFSVFLFFSCVNANEKQIIVGAEQPGKYLPLLEGKNVALVVNQTSMVNVSTWLIFCSKSKFR
ncbi:hypothetical protein [Prolixibacter bellariivorans]|uniref:hypothetical protein n=1 Tax=Prolixibacter bellariivorans TaxID=314319 RepID=UPI000A582D0A|nr:hypothetical protein [Prolixibacter bellariivorans]